jgi:hypothetical protein
MVAAAILLLGVADAAERDLVKALVGTWEGEIQFRTSPSRADPNRTLVIESVTPTDDGAIAQGRYGVTGKRMRKVVIDVDPSGRFLWMRFATSDDRPIKLTLIDDRALSGTIRLRGGATDRPMTLRKLSE